MYAFHKTIRYNLGWVYGINRGSILRGRELHIVYGEDRDGAKWESGDDLIFMAT